MRNNIAAFIIIYSAIIIYPFEPDYKAFRCYFVENKCRQDSCAEVHNDSLITLIKNRIKDLIHTDTLKNSDSIDDTIRLYKDYYLVTVHGKSYLKGKCTKEYFDSCEKEIDGYIEPDPCLPFDCTGWVLLNKALKFIDASYGISEKSVCGDIRKKEDDKSKFKNKLLFGLVYAIPVAVIMIMINIKLLK
jgi:hypothetical protein